jgi:GTPase
MLPVVTIVGRPNVGKSTLFNRLTKSRSALVMDLPGTTRDRNYGLGKIGEYSYLIVDTAGINDEIDSQSKKAIIESKIVLLVVDAHSGLMASDYNIINQVRKFNKKIILVINKIDGVNLSLVINDFFNLGCEQIMQISAKANKGINKLAEAFIEQLELNNNKTPQDTINCITNKIKVAIVGQPNVGKSTLINYLLQEDRVIVQDTPGTTRDSIYVDAKIGTDYYTLIDTAGVRRKARVKETLEKFSVIKTLQAIEDASVVILLIDATKGIVEQDLKLVGSIIDFGRSLVIAINKLDLISKEEQNKLQKNLNQELSFINFIKPCVISALHGRGIKHMFKLVAAAYESATKSINTNKLSLLLEQAVALHQPPLSSNGKRIKLRYAHLGGHLPFRVIIHGNQVKCLPNHYKKYLSSFFREKLELCGTMVNIELKQSNNPYINSK